MLTARRELIEVVGDKQLVDQLLSDDYRDLLVDAIEEVEAEVEAEASPRKRPKHGVDSARVEFDIEGISPRHLRTLFEELVETVERLNDQGKVGVAGWNAVEILLKPKQTGDWDDDDRDDDQAEGRKPFDFTAPVSSAAYL